MSEKRKSPEESRKKQRTLDEKVKITVLEVVNNKGKVVQLKALRHESIEADKASVKALYEEYAEANPHEIVPGLEIETEMFTRFETGSEEKHVYKVYPQSACKKHSPYVRIKDDEWKLQRYVDDTIYVLRGTPRNSDKYEVAGIYRATYFMRKHRELLTKPGRSEESLPHVSTELSKYTEHEVKLGEVVNFKTE